MPRIQGIEILGRDVSGRTMRIELARHEMGDHFDALVLLYHIREDYGCRPKFMLDNQSIIDMQESFDRDGFILRTPKTLGELK